jgi:hypothetical protein
MFSGCRDEQTSADAQINGVSEGKYIMLVCTHDWRQILLSSQIRCHELGFSRSHEISRRSDLQGGKLWSTSFFQLY